MVDGEAVATGGEALAYPEGQNPPCCCGQTNCTCANIPGCGVLAAVAVEGTYIQAGPQYGVAVSDQSNVDCCRGGAQTKWREDYTYTIKCADGACSGGLYLEWIGHHNGFLNDPGDSFLIRSNNSPFCCGVISQNSGVFTTFARFATASSVADAQNIVASFLQASGMSPPFSVVSGSFRIDCDVCEVDFHAHATRNAGGGFTAQMDVTIRLRAYLDPQADNCRPGECVRACCLPDGRCRDDLTPAGCRERGGVPQAIGTTCFEVRCDDSGGGGARPTGACCDPATGGCVLSSEEACLPPRIFRGNGTRCSPNPCPQPSGACCGIGAPGSCTQHTQVDCLALGGTWIGPNTACDPNPCSGPGGACCHADGTCTAVTAQTQCTAPGDTFFVNADCQGVNCQPQLGACCTQTSHGFDCQVTTLQSCSAGTWYAGQTCSPSPCGTGGADSLRKGALAFL